MGIQRKDKQTKMKFKVKYKEFIPKKKIVDKCQLVYLF